MVNQSTLIRKTHFLGTKIRNLRKNLGMTLEDLSVRCVQIDSDHAPSISYISLIETGRRVPSRELLNILAKVFQKKLQYFLDENIEVQSNYTQEKDRRVEIMSFEPSFLFSKDLLETALPAVLAQTGTTGRQFSHILIRAYQEKHQNQFPDIERLAEAIGKKKFPLSLENLLDLYKKHNLSIKWFDHPLFTTRDDAGNNIKSFFRSFYDSPNTVYINNQLKNQPARLKYDLASLLGHKVLHNGDGIISSNATGGELGGSPRPDETKTEKINQRDILFAWRDFESSFFAGALLCPKFPFRHFLYRNSYNIEFCNRLQLSPAVALRRMTAVSTYRYWHYFDAYPPGYLRAVYRGNGITTPWGNMRLVTDPCKQWNVFRAINQTWIKKPLHQLSLMVDGEQPLRLYSSISIRTKDAADNPHVISAGIDLAPVLDSQGLDSNSLLKEMYDLCMQENGDRKLNDELYINIKKVANVLNIHWIHEALQNPVSIICPRSTNCPRSQHCETIPQKKKLLWTNEVKDEILSRE